MKRVYTAVHIRFLSKRIRGTSYADITRLFNERFGLSATEGAIRGVLKRNGLRNNHGRGIPRKKKYLPYHIQFLKGIVKGRSYAEITGMFNRKFGFAISVKAMGSILKKHNLKNGRDCRIKPGNVPPNKGRKGYYTPGSEKGWFKPGQEPLNTMPLGSERVNANGYVKIKYAEKSGPPKNRWKEKHVLVWEKANGPVLKGHVVVFLDGDTSHIVLENLMMVSRKVHAVMCHMNWYTKDRETTKANCVMAEIKTSISNLKRKSFQAVKTKKMVFLNNNGYKVYVIQDKTRWISVRETRAGNLVRIRTKELSSKASRGEAQRDLYEYAAYRGWMLI